MIYRDYNKQEPIKQRGKIKPWKFRSSYGNAFDLSPLVPEHKECKRCKRLIPSKNLDFGHEGILIDFETKKIPICKNQQDCKKYIKKEVKQRANRNKKTKSSKKRK